METNDTQPSSAPSAPASPPPPPLPSRRTPQPPPLPPRVVQGPRLPPRFPRTSVIQETECLPPKRVRRPVTCSTCSSPNCSNHATTSQPNRPDHGRIRNLIVPENLVHRFKAMSMQNTIMRKETGGLLFGELKDADILVNVLVLPKQVGGPDFGRQLMKGPSLQTILP